MANKGIITTYTKYISCHLTSQEWKGEVILSKVRWGKFYRLQMKIVVPKFGSHEDWSIITKNTTFLGASLVDNNFKLWHQRVWCLHLEMILKMFWENIVIDIKLGEKKEKVKLCESCVYGKSHWLPFLENDKTSRARKLGIFSFWCLWSYEHSFDWKCNFFMLFIVDLSNFKFVYCTLKKRGSFSMFQENESRKLANNRKCDCEI